MGEACREGTVRSCGKFLQIGQRGGFRIFDSDFDSTLGIAPHRDAVLQRHATNRIAEIVAQHYKVQLANGFFWRQANWGRRIGLPRTKQFT